MEGFPLGRQVTIAELIDDPHAVNHRLRDDEPASWVPALDGWLVTRRTLVVQVMRDAERFTVDDPRFSTGRVVGPSMLSLDGVLHERHRYPFATALRRPETGAQLGAFALDAAHGLVAAMAGARSGDLRAALAGPLAVQVVTQALGLDRMAPAEVLDIYRAIVGSVEAVSAGQATTPAGEDAMATLGAAVRGAIEARTPLLAEASSSLAVAEVVSNVAVVMFGGVETGEGMISNALWHLLSNPNQLALVSEDRSLIGNAIEESLRLEPAATRVDRYTTENVEIGGAAIPRGDLVVVSLAGANRDPAVFQDPDVFDVRRKTAGQNVSFARGPHSCIGSHLARAETRAAIDAVLEWLPGLELGPDAVAPTGLVFRKPARIPVRWQ